MIGSAVLNCRSLFEIFHGQANRLGERLALGCSYYQVRLCELRILDDVEYLPANIAHPPKVLGFVIELAQGASSKRHLPIAAACLTLHTTLALALEPPPQPMRATAPVHVITSGCYPGYPPLAARAHTEGTTHLRYTVDATGHVTHGVVLGRSGRTREHAMLDQAALNALRTCPVRPAIDAEGRPAGATVDVIFVWRLEGGGRTPRPNDGAASAAVEDLTRETMRGIR